MRNILLLGIILPSLFMVLNLVPYTRPTDSTNPLNVENKITSLEQQLGI